MTTGDKSHDTLNYADQGGARTVIGGEIDIVDSGKLKLGGVDVTPALTIASQVLGAGAGYIIARGETALDGANPTPVVTGLGTVIGFALTLKGSVAPGLGTCQLTGVIALGSINVYAWKPTAADDCTLIASAGTETFDWVAVGTA